jgi:hypothetical protein
MIKSLAIALSGAGRRLQGGGRWWGDPTNMQWKAAGTGAINPFYTMKIC